ncbi:MAG TPA: 2-C-methyl-D-erythritol 2,4-cyclodiphosphate synthase [Candidatus Limnocylindrales bacterium]
MTPVGDAQHDIGFARDRHSFGPGEPLALGGLRLPGPRLHGHSDGDVVLHAVAGALLGAARLGDLGSLFPADDRTERGIESGPILRRVLETLAEAGRAPLAVDVSIEAARPRIGSHLAAMRTTIAELLDLDQAAVGIKASSGNLGADTGAGRAIEAIAVATVGRTSAGHDAAGSAAPNRRP